MTKKQIDQLSLSDAIKITSQNGMKYNFKTTDSEIKAQARKILRDEKKKQNENNNN